MREKLKDIDLAIISWIRRISLPLARAALFIVFFWFGLLKIIVTSPANPFVSALLVQMMPFITFGQFIIGFGIYEMLIGIAFAIPRLERLAIALLVPHMIVTALPLIILTDETWNSPFMPTMEGQYIIKNLAIIALAFSVAANLRPWREIAKR